MFDQLLARPALLSAERAGANVLRIVIHLCMARLRGLMIAGSMPALIGPRRVQDARAGRHWLSREVANVLSIPLVTPRAVAWAPAACQSGLRSEPDKAKSLTPF
ncbi:hypothetical protein SAMN02787142_7644 [Burkholderia sp. WP9]|nr:hypothetical protein SAMN02787142_7644 [Burkholderia sp. WP9]